MTSACVYWTKVLIVLCCIRDGTIQCNILNRGAKNWGGGGVVRNCNCITTTSGQSITSNISIIDDIVCSDHFPLCIEIVCDVNKLHDATPEITPKTTVKWHTANEVDKQRYNTKTKQIASSIVLPTDALLCKNTKCTELRNDTDNFYDSIIAGH